jgi:hypothetical protein
MKRTAAVLSTLACLAAVMAGCGASTESVDRTIVTVVKTVPAKKTPVKQKRTATTRGAPAKPESLAFVACDSNISARRQTTTCPFAENTFYEYWASGEAATIRAYSPATKRSYGLTCRRGTTVRCTAGDGAEVRFPAAAVSAYTDAQARAYAIHADLGPAESVAVDPGADDEDTYSDPGYDGPGSDHPDYDDPGYDLSYDDGDPKPDTGEYGDEIPNYDNGRGYRVQCADGMYSQSGGIQGACSGHGGVG